MLLVVIQSSTCPCFQVRLTILHVNRLKSASFCLKYRAHSIRKCMIVSLKSLSHDKPEIQGIHEILSDPKTYICVYEISNLTHNFVIATEHMYIHRWQMCLDLHDGATKVIEPLFSTANLQEGLVDQVCHSHSRTLSTYSVCHQMIPDTDKYVT